MSDDKTFEEKCGVNACAELVLELVIGGATKAKTVQTSLGSRVSVAKILNDHTPGGIAYLFEFFNPEHGKYTRIAMGEEAAWALFRLLGDALIQPLAPDHKIEDDYVFPRQWVKKPEPEDSEAAKAT